MFQSINGVLPRITDRPGSEKMDHTTEKLDLLPHVLLLPLSRTVSLTHSQRKKPCLALMTLLARGGEAQGLALMTLLARGGEVLALRVEESSIFESSPAARLVGAVMSSATSMSLHVPIALGFLCAATTIVTSPFESPSQMIISRARNHGDCDWWMKSTTMRSMSNYPRT